MAEQPPIERAFFREGGDGGCVFFPWGLTHRGYRLTGPDARKKAARAASLLVGSTVAIGSWAGVLLQSHLKAGGHGAREVFDTLAMPGAALGLALFSYWLWVSHFVEGQAESDLRVSREERLREAAAIAGPGRVALIGVVLCGLSALVMALQPDMGWIGLLGIGLGAGLLYWSHLLRNAAADSSARGMPRRRQ